MDLKKDSQTAVPIWIRLLNLPLSLWSAPAIGKIASAVGKPLYVDQRTEQMKMLSFAMVCVEIYANQARCFAVGVVLNGVSRSIPIEFKWKPAECPSCETFGHRCEDVAALGITDKEVPPVQQASVPPPPALQSSDLVAFPNQPRLCCRTLQTLVGAR
ncbi:uncharacterized protein LOC120287078 [Eucalyptus grandis]|uniref:uncharacterized protein LOC120287078 n=1 Tax=Eucalyptus grandis TaxID=71139 RepID=UPI00192ED5C8|nr:uncharacterized protein LOC120287078 [Eucalyptus grandis]